LKHANKIPDKREKELIMKLAVAAVGRPLFRLSEVPDFAQRGWKTSVNGYLAQNGKYQ
jgi:hypothetical protein